MAWWVARITFAANACGPGARRDFTAAPPGRRGPQYGGRRAKCVREDIPVALGGHDITWQGGLACPWLCRVCHHSAARRARLATAHCPGSAALRWARLAASAADAGEAVGRRHLVLPTGTVAWCWRCGAYSCARARNLAKPCPGHTRGFLVYARRRLLLGLHPATRVPLGAETVPEPGRQLPPGFAAEVCAAAISRVAAAAHTWRAPPCGVLPAPLAPPAPADNAGAPWSRLEAVRARVRVREAAAAAAATLPPAGPAPKRRRLHGKQPQPPA